MTLSVIAQTIDASWKERVPWFLAPAGMLEGLVRRLFPMLLPLPLMAAVALSACGTSAPAAQSEPAQMHAPASVASPSPSPTRSTPVVAPAPAATAPSARASASPGSVAPSAGPSLPTQVLTPGMSGPQVFRLQKRLAALKYYPGAIDGQFGSDTQEAVWAFQEVQGLTPSNEVNRAMLAALANPRRPVELVPGGPGTRIEISLHREVLVLYHDGNVELISHVSTGGGYYYCSPAGGCGYAITPTGDFRTLSFVPGWLQVPLGEMYNSVFFIGTAFAIHGDTYVPLQPASHGCVRIPMDIAAFFHTLVAVPGTPVYIRH